MQEALSDSMVTIKTEVKGDNNDSEVSPDFLTEVLQTEGPTPALRSPIRGEQQVLWV